MLPTPKEVRDVIRGAVDLPGVTPHSLLTLDPDGSLRVWRYVFGTASTGTRWYALADGARKRLAAPYHRRQLKRVPVVRDKGGPDARRSKSAGDAGGNVALDEEGSLSTAVDWAATGGADAAAELRARFHISRSTFLEDVPREVGSEGHATHLSGQDSVVTEGGGDRELVLAIEFDAVYALRRAFREDTKPAALEDIKRSPAALTLAGDGGPVRRSSMTIFTLTASSPLLRKGRTALIPVLFILGGEQAVHSAVGERLRERVKDALLADYSVPVRCVRRQRHVPANTGGVPTSSPTRDALLANAGDSPTSSVDARAALELVQDTPSALGGVASEAPDTTSTPAASGAPSASAADLLPWSTAAVRFLFLLRLCGDFAMIAHFPTLTGCSDASRYPYTWPCLPAAYLSVSLLAAVPGRGRDGGLLTAHWELVVWGLARWCSLRGGRWQATGGRLVWACAACKRTLVGYSSSPATIACTAPHCPMVNEPQAILTQPHAYTPLSDVFRLLRRRLGGPRGYPLVGDIPFPVQAPVMHCVGKLGKCIIYFMLALLSEPLQARARSRIYALLGRSNTGAMYLREFGRLGAMIIALPGVLGGNVSPDTGAVLMLRLCQLLLAAWRRALAVKSIAERERAAATLQLAAALLAPLYAALKPHDPVTKVAGVFNLYLHTAMVHVRQELSKASPLLRFITDDNIEGAIADMNRYFRCRTNNVSRGQSVVNKQALIPPEFKGEKEVKTGEKMLFTKDIVLCPCVSKIGRPAVANFEAVVRFACAETELTVTVAESTVPLSA